MQILDDLSYNKKTLKPIGRPVDDLKALYKEKKDDYNYVIDSLNATETALNRVQFNTKDKHIVDTANAKFQETFSEFEESGDFENRIVDTKRLANDLTNKFGLLRVQSNAQARGNYVTSLQDKVDKGELSSEKMNTLIRYSDRHYSGVVKNETSNGFTGSYSGKQTQPQIVVSEKLIELVKGIKSSTIPFVDANGVSQLLIRSKDGKGYLTAITKEFVSNERVHAFALSFIEGNDLIQSQYNEDIFLELDEIGEVNTMKLRQVLKGRTTAGIKSFLGITNNKLPSEKELEKILKERGITNEQAYAKIRKEQISDTDMQAAIIKETFVKYDTKFLKDWQLEDSTAANLEGAEFEMLHTYDNVQNVTSEDIKNTVKILEQSKESLGGLETELLELKDSADTVRKADVQNQIDRKKLIINDIEEQQSLIFENIDMNKMFERYDTIDEVSGGTVTNLPREEIRRLIYSEMNGTLSKETLRNHIEETASKKEWEETLKKGFGFNIRHLINTFDKYKDYKTNLLSSRVRHATNYFKEQIDTNSKDYVTQFNTLAFSNMSPKVQRAHPMVSTWDIVKTLPEVDSQFFQSMKSIQSDVSVKTHIEELFDLGKNSEEDGTIDWAKAKISPTLDYRPDKGTQEYRPALKLEVPIITSKKGKQGEVRQTAVIPVFYDNPNYAKRFKENLTKYREKLLQKHASGTLSNADSELLDRVNLNLYNTTKFSRDIDLKNLYNLPSGADTPIRVNDKLSMNVKSYKNNSPSGQTFYITEGTGDNSVFLGFDSGGNVVRLSENEMRSDETVQKVRNGQLKMLGGNTITALKTQFADITLSSNNLETSAFDNIVLKDIGNDSNIRLANNTFESTKINETVYPSVVDLFKTYPDIIATDISRNPNTSVAGSVTDSAHKINKGANAIDIRANDNSRATEQARAIEGLSNIEKAKLGIEKAFFHGEGNNKHLHIKFIK